MNPALWLLLGLGLANLLGAFLAVIFCSAKWSDDRPLVGYERAALWPLLAWMWIRGDK